MGSLTNYLKKIFNNQLLTGSLIVFIGSNLVNVLNYFYHLFMGRLLGPANYGELVSIFSLTGLLMMIPGSANLTITKFVSANKTDKDTQAVINWFYKKSYYLALILVAVTVVLLPIIGTFLNINMSWSLFMIPFLILFGIPTLFNRAILQGLLKFNQSIVSVIGENLIKLVLGIGLVLLGWSLTGAILGVLSSAALGWILSLLFLNKFRIKDAGERDIPLKEIYKYTVPILLQSVAATSLISTDIILVKHFFSPVDAGLYAALSTLGKVIFFCSGPIGTVMFPLVSKRSSRKENFYQVFLLSLVLTGIISFVILTGYFFVPQIAITMLYGSSYLGVSGNLVWFGVFITFYTLSSLITSFFLSLGKTWVVILTLVSGLCQICGIWFFHNSLSDVITVSIISSGLLFISLCIYLIYDYRLFELKASKN